MVLLLLIAYLPNLFNITRKGIATDIVTLNEMISIPAIINRLKGILTTIKI